LVAVACGGGSNSSNGGGSSTKGGTIREELQTFGWTDRFDPTGEYLGTAWALYDQMMMRGLLTYNHRPAEEGGNVPVPDIATDMPTVSSDGLQYDFTLKTGVKFGPPLNRDVTSKDIAYAFQRINTASLGAQYGNYYCGVITGMDCAGKDPSTPIKGIETPDATHITFHLDQPVGDFLYRLAMPATKAIPEEVAKCFPQAGDYSRYQISSGPYMFFGEGDLDTSSCDAMKPIAGYNVQTGLTLVRNPNYDASTDSTDIREANIDGLQQQINTNYNDIFQRLNDGQIDVAAGTPPKGDLLKYETDPNYQGWLHADPGDRTWYVTMNLFAAPFDDVHVRRAVNLAFDKIGVRKAYGGELRGEIATSVEPTTVLPESANINPYPENTGSGNVQAAMAEMAKSRYDTNKNGICDDGGACDNVLFLGRSEDPWPEMNQVAMASLTPILPGLQLHEVDTSTAYTTLQQVQKLIPIALVPGWGKDYNSPYGFDYYVFSSDGIFSCTAATNYSLVGISKDLADQCGIGAQYDEYVKNNGPVPNVDDAINQCVAKPSDQVNACYEQLDTKLMTDVVPWVPWVWSTNWTTVNPSVTKYVYDGNANNISYVNSAVNNGLAPENVA
jgi:peptide/nickel transport system substrate-binding protein